METDNSFGFARAMMVVSQFEEIARLAEGICDIIPLKGIALLTTLYKDNYDREVGDIDILVAPTSQCRVFIERMKAHGYRMQFDYLTDDGALTAKSKIALCHESNLATDVDIHLAFVTKKFFSKYCGAFNADALARCTKTKGNIMVMDVADQWLFLAQHACFHIFSDPKWLRDLHLLIEGMNDQQIATLHERARHYGFQRVCAAASFAVRYYFPNIGSPMLNGSFSGCMKRLTAFSIRNHRSWIVKKIVKPFWELLFIARPADRIHAHLSMICPNLPLLKSIYRRKSAIVALLYPLHFIITIVGMLLFYLLYVLVSIFFRNFVAEETHVSNRKISTR